MNKVNSQLLDTDSVSSKVLGTFRNLLAKEDMDKVNRWLIINVNQCNTQAIGIHVRKCFTYF